MRKWRGKWGENKEMERKWGENEEMERKRRENKEIERKWGENEEMERFTLRLWQHLDVNTGVSEMYST